MKPAIAPPQQKIQGFTLIELLIVIAVLGVLAAGLITIINPLGQLQKSRDAGRRTAVKQIRSALEAYAVNHGKYPNPVPNVENTNWTSSGKLPWLQDLINSGDIKVAPKDPIENDDHELHYFYKASISGGSDYCIMYVLEAGTTTDPLYAFSYENYNRYFVGPGGTKLGNECVTP